MTMEALMERLRSKADGQKSLMDTSKIVRMGMANRGHSLDINDKAILRSCLDTMQDSISVGSVAGMSERLETIARQMGLKFNHHNTTFYISTEAFYLEVRMDQQATVLDTVIHHHTVEHTNSSLHLEQKSPEIADSLSRGDFTTFIDHLKGLILVYAIPNCNPVDKARAWQSLYHLEKDLERLASRQAWITDLGQLIHAAGGLGMLHPRAGGIPLRLRYFLPPYELLDQEAGSILPVTKAILEERNLGFSATLTLRSSTEPFLLPLSSLLHTSGQEWQPLSKTNAVPLPAHPCLTLGQSLPMSWALIKRLAAVTGVDWLEATNNSPLLSIITRQASEGLLDPSNNRGLFVTLPDQQHCYFLTETPDLTGQSVEYVPFRHPNQVPAIMDILRTQAQFNTLIASCVRTQSLEDVDTSIMFEVTCLDPLCKTLSVTFEHPMEEVMATAELELSQLNALRCRVFTSSVSLCPEETADRVLQRSLSIPVTMRTVINWARGEAKGGKDDQSSVAVGGHSNGLGGHMGEMEGGQDHKVGGLGGKFKMSPGRGPAMLGTPAVCDPGGGVGVGVPGVPGAATRGEPMDTDSNAESLNRDGPQAAASLPGAQTQVKRTTSSHEPTFRHPSLVMLSDKTGGSKSENRLHRSDFPTSELENSDSSGGLSVSVSRGPLSDTQNKVRKESERVSPVERNCGVRPNVSITPISDSSLGDVEGSRSRSVTTTGIEIIPLGGQALTTGAGTQTKSKVRDFKRSLSEDDKRRLEKKEKRKREEKQRQGQESRSQTVATVTKLPPGDNSKLLGVIERLSYQSGDAVGLEIKPAVTKDKDRDRGPEPSVEITLDRLKPRTDKVEKPKLKLTIKTGAASTYDHIVSPNRLDTTFQIPKLFKADSPTHCRKEKSPSTSPKHSKPNKINERFITDPNRRTDDRKRSSEAPSSLSLHIVKSPVSSMSSSSISSLGDGIMEDSALLMQ